jgi:hypothetical protein
MEERLCYHVEITRFSYLLSDAENIYKLTHTATKLISFSFTSTERIFALRHLFSTKSNKMAAGDNSSNDMDTVDYEQILLYHLYVGNHLDQCYQEYLKNQQESSATAQLQEQQPHDSDSQSSSETPKDHPTPREFEKVCHATADPACERLAAETRQNVKLIEPRTVHTYRYTDAKTGEMVEKGVKPDMIVAFSHDGVRGKNVVVDAKSHKGAITMKDYLKLDRDRSVTKVRSCEISVKGIRLCFSVLESYSSIIRFSAHTPFFFSTRTVKYRLPCKKQ